MGCMNSEGMETWKTSDPQTRKLKTAVVCLPSKGNLSIFNNKIELDKIQYLETQSASYIWQRISLFPCHSCYHKNLKLNLSKLFSSKFCLSSYKRAGQLHKDRK